MGAAVKLAVKSVGLAAVLFLMTTSNAFASMSNYDVLDHAFKGGRAATAKELTNAYWLAVALASAPGQGGGSDGVWPNGQIPCEAGRCTQLMRIDLKGKKAKAAVRTTGPIGQELSSNIHKGSMKKSGLVLRASGDREMCATKTECRIVFDQDLVCAQSNDDSRGKCLVSYAKDPAAYLSYKPVHPF